MFHVEHRAALVVVSGLPGTGKSTLARALAAELDAAVLAKDVIEAALQRPGVIRDARPDSTGSAWAAHEVMTSLAGELLGLGHVVVLDAVAGSERIRRDWRTVASHLGVPFVVVLCECPDLAVHERRLIGRQRGIVGWPELTWDDVQSTRRRWEPWNEPHPGRRCNGAAHRQRLGRGRARRSAPRRALMFYVEHRGCGDQRLFRPDHPSGRRRAWLRCVRRRSSENGHDRTDSFEPTCSEPLIRASVRPTIRRLQRR